MNICKIINKLEKNIPSEDVYSGEFLYKHTTFKIGGAADIFVKAHSVEAVEHTAKVAHRYRIPLKILGNGSNILVNDKGIRGIVLKVELNNYEIIKEDNNKVKVIVEAGMQNPKLSQILLQEGITGFEFAAGIPGSIGGAVRMNAGAFDREFKDIVKKTTYLDLKDRKIKEITNAEHKFSYRHSIFSEINAVILKTELELELGNKEEVIKKVTEYLSTRAAKQPITMPSAGSTFKRGADFIASKIIDECELKGKAIGGAQVSTKHAGFIINTSGATAKEVMDLIEYVQKVVFEKTGKHLELEIEIW